MLLLFLHFLGLIQVFSFVFKNHEKKLVFLLARVRSLRHFLQISISAICKVYSFIPTFSKSCYLVLKYTLLRQNLANSNWVKSIYTMTWAFKYKLCLDYVAKTLLFCLTDSFSSLTLSFCNSSLLWNAVFFPRRKIKIQFHLVVDF